MRFNSLILLIVLFFVGIPDAHAYIDPGTGSAILQGVLGAIAALVLTARLWWHRLLVLLGIRKRVDMSKDGADKAGKSGQ